MRAPVWGLIATWSCFILHQLVQAASAREAHHVQPTTHHVTEPAAYHVPYHVPDRHVPYHVRSLLSTNDDEEPEKINLIIIPLMAFAAFMIFLCMRCCHWNQKDFRDRGIIIEHHHKKHIAQGLMHTRFDGQAQRRLSCVPEQLMLLPLFLTGSARSELNKMVDPPQDGIVEKHVSDCDSDSVCDSEPPSTDSEFDTPFPYRSPGRRRSSSVPPDLLYKGRFKKSRSSSIVDMRLRRLSVASAVSCKSTPQTLNVSNNQVNYNPNLLSVTVEMHEPPRQQDGARSGEATPESIVFPLPGDTAQFPGDSTREPMKFPGVPRFPNEIKITRDVSVETQFREVGVDTSDLFPPINHAPPINPNRLYFIPHRKFVRVRHPTMTSSMPSRRKRRRFNDVVLDGTSASADYNTPDCDLLVAGVHTNTSKLSTDLGSDPSSNNNAAEFQNLNAEKIQPFIKFNPFDRTITNGSSPNSSGNSLSNDSDHVHLPPLSLSPISCNSEFYRRLCSSEDSALAKSPVSEFSTDDRSNRDPLSRDSTLSPPPGGQCQNGRLQLHSKSQEVDSRTQMQTDGRNSLDEQLTVDEHRKPRCQVFTGQEEDKPRRQEFGGNEEMEPLLP